MDALQTYLKEASESLSAFATRIGRSPSTLSRAICGTRNPSIELARDVERGTDGRVTIGQFIDICLGRGQSNVDALPEHDLDLARFADDGGREPISQDATSVLPAGGDNRPPIDAPAGTVREAAE